MSETISQINVHTDFFGTWVDRTNSLLDFMSNRAVSANNNANGALTTGNGFVNGIFGSNTLVVYASLRGGNVQTANVLNISSNVSVGNTTSNVAVTFGSIALSGGPIINTSGWFYGSVSALNNQIRVGSGGTSAVITAASVNVGSFLSGNTVANGSQVLTDLVVSAGDVRATANVSGSNINGTAGFFGTISVTSRATVGNSTSNVVANTLGLFSSVDLVAGANVSGVNVNGQVGVFGNAQVSTRLSVGSTVVNSSGATVSGDVSASGNVSGVSAAFTNGAFTTRLSVAGTGLIANSSGIAAANGAFSGNISFTNMSGTGGSLSTLTLSTSLLVGNSTVNVSGNTLSLYVNGTNVATINTRSAAWVNSTFNYERGAFQFANSTNVLWTITDEAGNNRVVITPSLASTVTIGSSVINTTSFYVGGSNVATVNTRSSFWVNSTTSYARGRFNVASDSLSMTVGVTDEASNDRISILLSPRQSVNVGGTTYREKDLAFQSGNSVNLNVVDEPGNNLIRVTASFAGVVPPPTTPSGGNTSVQFNDSGNFNGVAGFQFDKGLNQLSVANVVAAQTFSMNSMAQFQTLTGSTATTGAVALDSFPLSTWKSAKYSIQANSAIGVQMTEVAVIHDGASVYSDEYLSLNSNTSLGVLATFTADVSGGNIRLLVTPSTSGTITYRIVRQLMVV